MGGATGRRLIDYLHGDRPSLAPAAGAAAAWRAQDNEPGPVVRC
jgi:glutathione S-transferase